MNNEDIKRIINHESRFPHFHPDFPLLLFWSPKSGCTSLANWFFFQIGLLDIAMQYNPFIHIYEYEVYKNNDIYLTKILEAVVNNEKDTCKLVRNPYKRAVSSFLILADPPYQSPQWDHIRESLFHSKHNDQGISFRQFLYYIKNFGADSPLIDPHFSQQYIEGEEMIVKKHIYLEDFKNEISNIENKYNLNPSSLSNLSQSSHHRYPMMKYTGDYADIDITDRKFPHFPTYV